MAIYNIWCGPCIKCAKRDSFNRESHDSNKENRDELIIEITDDLCMLCSTHFSCWTTVLM